MLEDNAVLISDELATADARGVYSHGVNFLPGYIKAIREGWVNPNPTFHVVKENASSLLIDGDVGLGGVVIPQVIDYAIKKVHGSGSCTISITNCGSYGAGAYYVNRVADENMIAFLYGNACKAAAPFGGRNAYLGTNPYSFAAPAGKYGYVTLDMATTETAGNKIMVAAREGKQIKPGIGVDRYGKSTTDPQEILEFGSLCHFGGVKGYGIAFMINILTGVLSGSAYKADDIDLMGMTHGHPNISFYMHIIDIQQFNSIEKFIADIEDFITDIKAVEPADGFTEVCYPGEIEYRNYKNAISNGVHIRDEVYKNFVETAQMYDISVSSLL